MKLLVVAGEASADIHAAHVLARLKERHSVELLGVGGSFLEKLGLKPIRHARDMAVVGLTEAIQKIPQTLGLLRDLERMASDERPDAALLLDLPDFNLRLAPRLKRLGIPVIYYISPQVWAWRSRRVFAMAECIDLLLSILPFEKAWYSEHAPKKLRVEYVGHPVLEEIPDLPYQPNKTGIAILPGSRESEWRNLFGPMIEAASLLIRSGENFEFVLPLAEPLRGNTFVEEVLSSSGPYAVALEVLKGRFRVVENPAHEILRNSRAAWIASGTATLEAGVVGIPMVVAYKVSAATAFIFRNFVRYKGPVAMVNLIHAGLGNDLRVVPELLQAEVQPEALAGAMREILQEKRWNEIREKLSRTRMLLSGEGMPIENAAKAVELFLEGRG